ncbi:protein YgfX [Paraburkholderia sp. MPAMCS5]|uniref:protein YgfX n=1 Tax=Paraburkholderia sp. MPAMCS5 TaxID=3112563 RepID=UPI002E19B1DC|nr:protein YgfX [Paraburkholderia sp. MPAMCS5]
MCVALAAFVLVASGAVYRAAAPWLGAWQAVPLTLAACALLALCSVMHGRTQPVAIKLGRDGLTVWGRAGGVLAHGRIAGCAHWSDHLLVLTLVPDAGRRRTLLLPADSLSAAVFRALAVRGRRRAGA